MDSITAHKARLTKFLLDDALLLFTLKEREVRILRAKKYPDFKNKTGTKQGQIQAKNGKIVREVGFCHSVAQRERIKASQDLG